MSELGTRRLIFLIPITGVIFLNIGGQLYISEALLLGYFANQLAYNGLRPIRYSDPIFLVIFLGSLWLGSQVISDVINGTSFANSLKGFAKISVFFILLISLKNLLVTGERLIAWLIGVAIFVGCNSIITIGLGDFANLWKFGLGWTVFTLCIAPVIIMRRRNARTRQSFLIGALIAYALACFAFNARSGAGLSLVSAALIYSIRRLNGRIPTMPTYIFVAMGLLCMSFLTAKAYTYAAGSGVLGVEAKYKYEMQGGQQSLVGVLLGGRPESIVSAIAIKDSPWIGHGSWATDYYYTALLHQVQQEMRVDGLALSLDSNDDEPIPAHSYLLGSWVESGLMGAAFWSYILFLSLFKAIPKLIQTGCKSPAQLMLAINIIPLTWDVMFSPFGATARIQAAAIIALLTTLVSCGEWFEERSE